MQDPKLYMIKWLAERCSDEQLKKSGLERKRHAACVLVQGMALMRSRWARWV